MMGSAALAYLLARALAHRRIRVKLPLIAAAAVPALALLLGFQWMQYGLFKVQVGQEITDRLAQDLTMVTPREMPALIHNILARRTGVGGIAGYTLLRFKLGGPGYIALWLARWFLTFAAAYAVVNAFSITTFPKSDFPPQEE
jgi:hypothetical protein